jgi:hypothetical protein
MAQAPPPSVRVAATDAATAAERAADSGQRPVIVAFVDFSYDRQIMNVDRL